MTVNHIPSTLAEARPNADSEADWRTVVDAAIEKHFDLWGVLKTPDRLSRIEELLRRDLMDSGVEEFTGIPAFALFEALEYKNRQSKYVVAGQRTYEWHGFDWRLPLWDNAFIDFWQRVPLAEKLGQKLFADTLRQQNWGGVWGAPFWPQRNITPRWMILPRLLAKACHAPIGRDAWHRFERQYIAWHTDTVCNYAVAPYGRVAADRRGHRNAISWHVDRYLRNKGLDISGTALEKAD